MPNEALERLMACLLASIAKKKKWKKRELLLLSLHPLNKLKHNDTEQVQKKYCPRGPTRCTGLVVEFTILPSECWREGERRRHGGGGRRAVEATNLKERERGMIGWFIQRVGESNFNGFWECKLFPLPLQSWPSRGPAFLARLHLISFTPVSVCCHPPLHPLPPNTHNPPTCLYAFRIILFDGHSQKTRPAASWQTNLRPRSPQRLVNQGALHAQWDKLNDRKVKRGPGGDLPSRVAGICDAQHYVLG